MKIKILLLLCLCLFCPQLIPSVSSGDNRDGLCEILDALPEVTVNGKTLVAGATVPLNSVVKTGATGKALIKLPDGMLITVDSESEFSFVRDKGDAGKEELVFKLDKGAAKMEPGPGSDGKPFSILAQTPQALIDPKGATLGIQSALDETLVFIEKLKDLGVVVKDIVSGVESVLSEAGKVLEMLKGKMTEKTSTRMERDFFKNIAAGLNPQSAENEGRQTKQGQEEWEDVVNRYKGTWKARAPFNFTWAAGNRIARKTVPCDISITIGDVIREVKLSTYKGNVNYPIKASDDRGFELEVTNVEFPTVSNGKIVSTTLPRGLALISPETGTVRVLAEKGRLSFGVVFQIESARTAYGIFIDSIVIRSRSKSGIDAMADGRCANPREVVFER